MMSLMSCNLDAVCEASRLTLPRQSKKKASGKLELWPKEPVLQAWPNMECAALKAGSPRGPDVWHPAPKASVSIFLDACAGRAKQAVLTENLLHVSTLDTTASFGLKSLGEKKRIPEGSGDPRLLERRFRAGKCKQNEQASGHQEQCISQAQKR